MNEIKETILNKSVFEEEPEKENNNSLNKEEKSFEEKLKEIGKTEKDVINTIEQLVENNKYEEVKKILNGKLEIKLVSPTPGIADALLTLAEEWTDGSMSKFEHKYSVATVASILEKYKDINLNEICKADDEDVVRKNIALLKCKIKWIEENIPMPIYDLIAKEVTNFNKFLILLESKDMVDFLNKTST